jgi:signal recognition particle subunit SEC65
VRSLPEKLDSLEYDIISLLQKHEPKMLRWNEVVKSLWESYKFKYKDERGFGTAITNKLNLLVASGKVKHEKLYYGTPSSILTNGPSKIDQKFRDTLQSKFWVERSEVLKLREGGLDFGNGTIFEAWERTERFAELLPPSPLKDQLRDAVKKVHNDVYEPDKIYYPRAFVFTQEERAQLVYPKARMLYDVIPEIWEKIAELVQSL